jgi:hypothetical protein
MPENVRGLTTNNQAAAFHNQPSRFTAWLLFVSRPREWWRRDSIRQNTHCGADEIKARQTFAD